MEEQAIEFDTSKIGPFAGSDCLAVSRNGRFGALPHGENQMAIIDGWKGSEPIELIELEGRFVNWCSISDCGNYLAYGIHSQFPKWCYFLDRSSNQVTHLPKSQSGLISGETLWLLIDFDNHIKIERRCLFDLKVMSSVFDPKWRDFYSMFDGGADLVETYRLECLGITAPGLAAFYIEKNDFREFSARQVCEYIFEYPAANCSQYFAPHGDEAMIISDQEICRYTYPFDSVTSRIKPEGLLDVGCYLDDVHFLASSNDGSLYLLHSRSNTIVAKFKPANIKSGSILLAAQKIGGLIFMNFEMDDPAAKTTQFVVKVDDFFSGAR